MDTADMYPDQKTAEKLQGYRWVISFDRQTGERDKCVICPASAAEVHRHVLELDGTDVRVFGYDEALRLIAEGKLR